SLPMLRQKHVELLLPWSQAMAITRTPILFALAIAAASVFGGGGDAGAGPRQLARVEANGLPQPRCSRPAEQESLRIQRLVDMVAETRAAASRDPLLLADVGYYEAELAASRRCVQSVASR